MSAARQTRKPPALLLPMVQTLLPRYPELQPDIRIEVEQSVAGYVAGQIAAMPTFLRVPYRLAMFAFDTLSLARHGRRFRALSPTARERYVGVWSNVPISAMRDFVKLIRSTALLVYFDHPLVRERLDLERLEGSSARSEDRARE